MSPCENCITLVMCRSRMDGGDLFDLCSLSDQCPKLKSLIFPGGQPLVTAKQTRGSINRHIDFCVSILKDDLLKGIKFSDQFNT